MLRKFLGVGKKRNLKYWHERLAQARQELWDRNLSKAKQLFAEIVSDLGEHRTKDVSYNLNRLSAEAKLGLWAVEYYQDATKRSIYREIISQIKPDARIWLIISKVFYEQQDISPEAMTVYASLLRAKPSKKIARQFLELVSQGEVSEEKLTLLGQITSKLPKDKEACVELCRSCLQLQFFDKALEYAKRILELDANDVNAHRCIAYVAERRQNWEKAARHYRVSQDWLRLLVVYCKAREIAKAAEILEMVPETQRDTSTWLYYTGWIRYKQGRLEEALRCWQTLESTGLDQPSSLSSNIEALIEKASYDQLDRLSLEHQPQVYEKAPYAVECHLRLGAIKLLLARDPQAADPHLRYVASQRPHDVVPITYLALCKAAKRRDTSSDGHLYQEIANRYNNGTLFLWLRGLWLASDAPGLAQQYLAKAIEEKEIRYLSEDAISVTEWLVAKLNGKFTSSASEGIEGLFDIKDLPWTETASAPFLWAVVSSYGLELLHSQDIQSPFFKVEQSFPLDSDTSWASIQAVCFAREEKWLRALQSLDKENNVDLEHSILTYAIQERLKEEDWDTVAELVSKGVKRFPRDSDLRALAGEIEEPIRRYLWQKQELESLEPRLQEDLSSERANTRLHHNLAIVYTKMAIDADTVTSVQSDHSNEVDHWIRAIGHWAVVLSDSDYWSRWKEQRGQVYSIPVEILRGEEIRQKVPELIKKYHDEQASKAPSASRERHSYYAALIDYEIEVTSAMRYLVRASQRHQNALPNSVYRLLSPVLLKEYGGKNIGRKIIRKLNQMVLSPHETQLLEQAFSPLADVYALKAGQQYQMALKRLQSLHQDDKQDGVDLRQVEQKLLKLYTRKLINKGRWEEALINARRGINLQPVNKEMRQLLVDASVGWAEWQIQQEAYEAPVQEIRCLLRILDVLQENNREPEVIRAQIEDWVRPNLNEVNEEVLASIPGVGLVLAERIVASRKNEGVFTSLEDLIRVEGVGKETASQITAHFVIPQPIPRSKLEEMEGWLPAKVKATTSEALALARLDQWDSEEQCFDREALEREIEYLERALILDPDNPRARAGAAAIYHDLAVDCVERNDWVLASEYAERAFEYGQRPEYLNLLAVTNHDYAIHLAQQNRYDEAISLLEPLVNLPYDRNMVNLEKLISGLYTDVGANLYNTGYVTDAVSCWQVALEYDSTNSVARSNLNMAIGGYW